MMRKVISYIFLFPALALLAIGLTLMALALSAAGGRKGRVCVNPCNPCFY